MSVGMPSNFNSPAAGSAWWAEVLTATDQFFVASQGKNVYADFKAMLRYRSPEAELTQYSIIGAADLRELEQYFNDQADGNRVLSAVTGGLGGGGSIPQEFADQLNATLEAAALSGRMSPQAMRIILWFTYGMAAQPTPVPLSAYAVAADTVFPPLGVEPPAPGGDGLATPVKWKSTDPIPAAIRPTIGATTPGSTPGTGHVDTQGRLTQPTNLVTDLETPMSPWVWVAVAAGAVAVVGGVGFWMYTRNQEKKQLGYGAYAMEDEEFEMEDDDADAMEWHRSGYRRSSGRGRR